MPMLGVDSIGQLKCIYANARSMGNKQEELEAIVQQDSYDLVAIMETWWDDSHDWSAAMDGYKLFRRDRQGRRGGGVAVYVRECFDCTELHDSDDKVECLWVRMRGKANKADIVLGVCYRPPDQVEETDESFYKRLAVVSESCARVLVRDFNFPDVCWKYNTAVSKQSRRFLECVEDNFLTQLVAEMKILASKECMFTSKKKVLRLHVSSFGEEVQYRGLIVQTVEVEFISSGANRTAALQLVHYSIGMVYNKPDSSPVMPAVKQHPLKSPGPKKVHTENLKKTEQRVLCSFSAIYIPIITPLSPN
ncbi:uncharacterized protein ACIBXB_005763 [Morphnus guianensis]